MKMVSTRDNKHNKFSTHGVDGENGENKSSHSINGSSGIIEKSRPSDTEFCRKRKSKISGTDDQEKDSFSSDDEFPKKRKSKFSKQDDGSESFSCALKNILSSRLKSYDRKNPILARNKKVLKQNEADKLELKARKMLNTEKKEKLNSTRKKEIIPVGSADENAETIRELVEKERRLRKIAQKGVVKLFNVILSTQLKTSKEIDSALSGVKNKQEKKKLITEISKESFLDLVKTAGNN